MSVKSEVETLVRAAEGGHFDEELADWWTTSSTKFPSNGDREVARRIVRKAEALFDRRLTNRWRGFDAIMDWDFQKRYPGVESRWARGWRQKLSKVIGELPWP